MKTFNWKTEIEILTIFLIGLGCLLFLPITTLAQEIEWDKSFGGIENINVLDLPYDIHKLDAGGFIVSGIVQSDDGDVSFHNGYIDFWILRLDENGDLDWEKTFGGSDAEGGINFPSAMTSSIITSENTIMMTGFTESDDGDVSDSKTINPEVWVINVDLEGNLLWEESYIFDEESNTKAYSIIETSNGDYVIAGRVSQHENTKGISDFLILRIDNNGNLLWKKNYGGSESESAESVVELENGDLMVIGTSRSNDGDVSSNYGGNDGSSDTWIIRLNNEGELIWEKNYGGSGRDGSLFITPTYEYKTSAVVDGNGHVTVATITRSTDFDVQSGIDESGDIWVFQIDGDGNIIWEQVFGGSSLQFARDIILTESNDFFVTGTTAGIASRDIEEIIGFQDTWLIKIDNNGSLLWEHTFGGTHNDYGQSLVQLDKNNYVGLSYTRSNDVDVSNNPDKKWYWIFKFNTSDEGDDRDSRTEILYEDFDGEDFLPEGWTNSSLNINYTWFKGVLTYNDFSSIDPDHHSSALVTTWEGEEKDEWMISPEFDLTGSQNPTVSFYVNYDPEYLSFAEMKLNISTDENHDSWTELWKTENDGNGLDWRRIEIDLNDYKDMNGLKLAWQYVGEDGEVMGVDSIYVSSAGQISTSVEEFSEVPDKLILHQNYPNPFNPSTQIRFDLPNAGNVTIEVYNMLGQKVATLANKRYKAGRHKLTFEAGSVSSGMYIYRIKAGAFTQTKKMMLIK